MRALADELKRLLYNLLGMFLITLIILPVDLLVLLFYQPRPEWYDLQRETFDGLAPEIMAGGRWLLGEIERMLMGE